MGVLNVTPDSFSDGGQLYRAGRADLDAILHRADAMVAAGASLLDIGGESTRPGAEPVTEAEELARVVPVVEALAGRVDAMLSVDSSTPAVMCAAADAGAHLINDVRALRRRGALEAAAASGLPVCLMHMQGSPETMQADPRYVDVVTDVEGFLHERVAACRAAGIDAGSILLDPGFGFGKTVAHNLALLAALPRLGALGHPLLVGLSRKSLIAKLLGRSVEERLPASLALAVLAAERGASIIRAHDVAETADALAMVAALAEAGAA
ncbi:dihydropteroate synthase [Pseudohaliea sp.]|uniref:dihydropteroate synthase n=1 Tax=Pseudohaliea sp. TaxID=2740289 RepID=UPI0032EB5EE7